MKIEINDSLFKVTWRTLSCGSVFLFLLLSVMLIPTVIAITAIFLPMSFLSGSIALGIWLLGFGYGINILSGKTKLTLDETGFERTYTSICYKQKKRIDLAEIRHFETTVDLNKYGGKTENHKLNVACQGKDILFKLPMIISSLQKKRQIEQYCSLSYQLNVRLGEFKSGTTEVPGTQETEEVNDSWWKVPAPVVFELDSQPQYLEPSPNSQWCFQKGHSDTFIFQIKGEGNLADFANSLLGAIFAGFLLIGAVSIMVLFFANANEGTRKGGLAAASVFFFIGAVRQLRKVKNDFWTWSRRTTLKFTHRNVEFRRSQFGISQTMNADMTDWDLLVVCLPQDVKADPKVIATGNPTEVENFFEGCNLWHIEFYNTTGENIPLVIERLTKPEALWMADVILQEQKSIR